MPLPEQLPLAEAAVSIRISEKIEISPTSEVEIMAHIEGHQELLGSWLLEEATRKCSPAVVAHALVRVTGGHVPVGLVNIRSDRVCYFI